VEHAGEAALVLSFLLFLLVVARVLMMDRDRLARLERLPLDDSMTQRKESAP
jgi:hypothetical protein